MAACDDSHATADAGKALDATAEAAVVDASEDASEVADADVDAPVDYDARAARGITMIEEISVIIHANEKDCDKMGSDLDAYYKKNGEVVDSLKQTYMKMPRAERKPIQQKYRARFDAAWKKLQPGLKKCKDEPNVKRLVTKAGSRSDPDAGLD